VPAWTSSAGSDRLYWSTRSRPECVSGESDRRLRLHGSPQPAHRKGEGGSPIQQGLQLPKAHASNSGRPSAGRGPTSVAVSIAADTDLVTVSGFGIFAIFPGMEPESTPQRLGHVVILLWFRLAGKSEVVQDEQRLSRVLHASRRAGGLGKRATCR
jgi:hypothetical protein